MASPNNTTVASADDATMSSDEGFIMISHDGVGPLSQLNGLLKSNPSEEHVRVVASTSHFLLEPHSKLELGMLDRYLSHDPPRESPSGICVMPPHELSERLRLLAKFQETFAREVGKLNCRMSKNSLAAWLVAPLDVLRKGADVETYGMGGYLSLRRGLIAISQLICQFDRPEENGPALDGRPCIVTGTANADVCRILPHAPYTSRALLDVLRESSLLIEGAHQMGFEVRFFSPPGSPWNTITLGPQLGRWWARAYLGLKCLDIRGGRNDNESILALQLHWLPKPVPTGLGESSLGEHIRHQVWGPEDGVAAYRAMTGRPVLTGDSFEVTVKTRDAVKMKWALDIQWSVAQMRALVGPQPLPQ